MSTEKVSNPPGEPAAATVAQVEVIRSAGPFAGLSNWSHLALVGLTLIPNVVPVDANVNILATATLAVWSGSHRSIKPTPMTETMTKGDAMRFPLVGSCVLFGLFLLFKFLPKDLVNTVLTAYFLVLGVVALTSTLLPFIEQGFNASVNEREFKFGSLKIPYLFPEATEVSATVPKLIGATVACVFCGWYISYKHWMANNILGLAFSIQAIEFLSVGSVQIGAILLCGLFVYDIFWVFCTPVMVTVAKSFDAPIKLLFPRALDLVNETRPFSMLGLGDIVVPGIFVAILLRYDNRCAKTAAAEGKKPSKGYFHTAVLGYIAGLLTTIVVMNVFNAAQPALLYIVPGVLIPVMMRAMALGETKQLLAYDESSKENVQAVTPEHEGADVSSSKTD